MRIRHWAGRHRPYLLVLCAAASFAGCSSAPSGPRWPSDDPVVVVDRAGQFPANLSGLAYESSPAGDHLWAVRNQISGVFRLTFDGTTWNADSDDLWSAGRRLRFPGDSGDPDAEGITLAEVGSPAVYVSVERDNISDLIPRLSVLRFDTSAPDAVLVATHEWNLTADLPSASSNAGLEGIAWIPDAFLVANGFFDEDAGAAYAPARYPDHGTGLFFVGMEGNGLVFAYALDHATGAFRGLSSFATGLDAVMDLAFDRDVGALWAYCDVVCGNRATVLGLGASGRFEMQQVFEAPKTLPDSENEGIAIAPESACADGRKSFYWSDDAATGGHAIRRGTIPCGRLSAPATPGPMVIAPDTRTDGYCDTRTDGYCQATPGPMVIEAKESGQGSRGRRSAGETRRKRRGRCERVQGVGTRRPDRRLWAQSVSGG